jgi:hypothetical protein
LEVLSEVLKRICTALSRAIFLVSRPGENAEQNFRAHRDSGVKQLFNTTEQTRLAEFSCSFVRFVCFVGVLGSFLSTKYTNCTKQETQKMENTEMKTQMGI